MALRYRSARRSDPVDVLLEDSKPTRVAGLAQRWRICTAEHRPASHRAHLEWTPQPVIELFWHRVVVPLGNLAIALSVIGALANLMD